MRRLALALAIILSASAVSFAQGPPQPPLASQFPAWITPPTFINGGGVASGSIIPAVDNTYDLGSSTFRWRNLFIGTAVQLPDGTPAAPSLTFVNATGTGWYRGTSSGRLIASVAGTGQVAIDSSTGFIATRSDGFIGFLSGTAPDSNGLDVVLARDAANTLALRNGASTQQYNLYNTYTSGSNYERVNFGFGNNFSIGTTTAEIWTQSAVGTDRSLNIGTGAATTHLYFSPGGSVKWQLNNLGNWVDSGSHTITAGSTITATTGNIVATAGNVSAASAFQIAGNAFGSSTVGPSSVTGTTSTAALQMAGLGGSFTTRSGRFAICMSGNLDNTTVNDGSKVQISFGTTVPVPTLNAPLQGTQVGPIQQLSQTALPAATITPYGACWVVTGQTKNTTFWTDVAYGAITGGQAVLTQASVIAYDIP